MSTETHLHSPTNNVIVIGAKSVDISATKAHAQASLSLASINRAAAELAALRARLIALAAPIVDQIQQLRESFAVDAKPMLAQLEKCESEIKLLLQTYPGCLGRRKTLQTAGIKCGFRKSVDRLDIGADAVELILQHLDAERFLRTEVVANKEALESLSDAQLERVNCARIKGKDQAFVARDQGLDARLKLLSIEAH